MVLEAACSPSQPPRPSGDDPAPACLRGRKEVKRVAGGFLFSALLQALGSLPQCLGAGDGSTMAPRTAAVRQTCCCFNVRIATTALAIYHVVSGRVGAGGCVCVCVQERGPQSTDPLGWEDRCPPPLRGSPARSLPCSGPQVPLFQAGKGGGALQQLAEWSSGGRRVFMLSEWNSRCL